MFISVITKVNGVKKVLTWPKDRIENVEYYEKENPEMTIRFRLGSAIMIFRKGTDLQEVLKRIVDTSEDFVFDGIVEDEKIEADKKAELQMAKERLAAEKAAVEAEKEEHFDNILSK